MFSTMSESRTSSIAEALGDHSVTTMANHSLNSRGKVKVRLVSEHIAMVENMHHPRLAVARRLSPLLQLQACVRKVVGSRVVVVAVVVTHIFTGLQLVQAQYRCCWCSPGCEHVRGTRPHSSSSVRALRLCGPSWRTIEFASTTKVNQTRNH